jgi:hypothetical protein
MIDKERRSDYDAAGKETVMIELTEQQQREVSSSGWPPCVLNPKTGETFVLLHREMFDRVRDLLAAEDEISAVEEMYPLTHEALDAQGHSRESA